jgi:tyrosyl-tRNA synthetase
MAVEIDRQVAILKQGIVDLQTEKDLRIKLRKSLTEGRPLMVKLGADPTAPDIHLGHAVVLTKLRAFQDLGHQVTFLIGDFTALIGDPTGKKEMRPMLSEDEVNANAETYIKQVYKILNPDQTVIRFNSEWMKKMSATDLIRLAGRMTVARMIERDDFKKRYTAGIPIGIHEFLYPMVQGYDSVALEADVELGGTDQLFNLLVGRELQRHWDQAPQVVMTVPLLEGTDARVIDGVLTGAKMSKSLGNYVGISEPAPTQFGKIMSISDDLMWRYYLLLSGKTESELEGLKASVADGSLHPMEAKKALARLLVERFHGPEAAVGAQQDFETRFSKREIPEDLPEKSVEATSDEGIALFQLLREAGLAPSGKEARRSCQQGAVRIDGDKVMDPNHQLLKGSEQIVQVGRRRIARVNVV